MVAPNNTMSMYRNLQWHSELQQILTSPADEYALLREQRLLNKTNLQLPSDGTPLRLFDTVLPASTGRYAELEVTFALPKEATNFSVMTFADPHGYNRSGYDGLENVILFTPPPTSLPPHKTYYEVTGGCLKCWHTGQGNGKPWLATDHLFPLRLLATDTNLTIHAFMDGGFAETYWMEGRAAQIMGTLNDTEADWTGPSQKSAMYVRATSASSEPVVVLSAVAHAMGEIWVTPEQLLATPPPPARYDARALKTDDLSVSVHASNPLRTLAAY